MKIFLAALFSLVLLSGTSSTPHPKRQSQTTVIPQSSFESYTSLEQYWAYLYPWGSDHNGSARMQGNSTDHDHISVADGVLTLKATPTTTPQPPSTAAPNPAIHYISGTIYAKQTVTVGGGDAEEWTVGGEFKPPTAVGTWPAFWLTAVEGWPPESDIAEWKGTQQIWFNTFNTSSAVKSTIVNWPDDGQFHSASATLSTIPGSATDVSIGYYLDGALQATHVGAGYVGKALWLIIDLQMEGSSGTPGPADGATYQVRNVELKFSATPPEPPETERVHDEDFVVEISGYEELLRRLNELDNAGTCLTNGKGTNAKWRLPQPGDVSVLKQFADVAYGNRMGLLGQVVRVSDLRKQALGG